MAPILEPRRSSRARGPVSQSQNLPSNPAGRIERSGRILSQTSTKSSSSSAKSTPSASLLSEPFDYMEDNHLPRRKKRAVSDEPTPQNLAKALATTSSSGRDWGHEMLQDTQEEDDAVRCICGSDDYPGLPLFDDDARLGKDAADAEFYAAIELTEDVTGFFLQCDTCKVWQHGACVGIITLESSPDEYFCEKCRKDLHKIHAASNGQQYSHYLPLHRPLHTASTSRAASVSKDGNRSPKSSASKSVRSNATTQATKRRSTMNSRDAAYDEEQLRRAIEASKEDIHDSTDSASRRTKRGRSDSEENSGSVKRQRTSSESLSPNTEKTESAIKDDSDDGVERNGTLKKPRNGRVQREKPDRDDKSRRQLEASAKKKTRPERKETEDSERPEGTPLVSRAVGSKNTEPSPALAAEASLPPQEDPDTPLAKPAPTMASNKKSSKNNQKKTKGRNQYTKDREVYLEGSPSRCASRDAKAADDTPTFTSKAAMAESKLQSRHKHATNSHAKFSMHDMKRRATAYLEFISRTQIELAAETSLPLRPTTIFKGDSGDRQEAVPKIQVNGSNDTYPKGNGNGNGKPTSNGPSKKFNDMNSREMMDVLTRRLVKWQDKYLE